MASDDSSPRLSPALRALLSRPLVIQVCISLAFCLEQVPDLRLPTREPSSDTCLLGRLPGLLGRARAWPCAPPSPVVAPTALCSPCSPLRFPLDRLPARSPGSLDTSGSRCSLELRWEGWRAAGCRTALGNGASPGQLGPPPREPGDVVNQGVTRLRDETEGQPRWF